LLFVVNDVFEPNYEPVYVLC